MSEEDSASAVVGVSAVLLRAQVAGRAQSSVAGGEDWGWGSEVTGAAPWCEAGPLQPDRHCTAVIIVTQIQEWIPITFLSPAPQDE